MGLEESRHSVDNNGGCVGDSRRRCRPRPVQRRSLPWATVQRCSLRDWSAGMHDELNFDQPALACSCRLHLECTPGFCISQQTVIPVSKWHPAGYSDPILVSACTTKQIRRAVKFSKMAQHLEYNHIPASLSSIQKFSVKSILCHRGSLILLHLIRNMASQFGVVDFRAHKFLGIFAKQPVEFAAEAVRAEIAPDEAHCILLMPSVKQRQRRLDVLMLCDLVTKEVLSEILLPAGCCCEFAFDPRFSCYRVALTAGANLVGEPDADDAASRQSPPPPPTRGVRAASLLSLLDCRGSWRRLRSVQLAGPGLRPRRLLYSRAGHLLLAVAVDCSSPAGQGIDADPDDDYLGFCRCFGDFRRRPLACQLVLLDSDSLARLRRISYSRLACPLHSCPAAYSPVMSRCGSRLALSVSLSGGRTEVTVRQLPQPPTLRAMARELVLQIWSDQALSKQLALPSSLKAYLRFGPELACGGACQLRPGADCC